MIKRVFIGVHQRLSLFQGLLLDTLNFNRHHPLDYRRKGKENREGHLFLTGFSSRPNSRMISKTILGAGFRPVSTVRSAYFLKSGARSR